MNKINKILSTDGYKFSQYTQYPAGVTNVFSYIESRGSKIPGVDYTVFFGLQAYIKDRLTTPITQQEIDEAEAFCGVYGVPFNRSGWQHILKKHGGFLPLIIKAVPEGTVVPTGNALVTVQATDPECYWLTSYVETDILRYVWYGSTVATVSHACRGMIRRYLDETSDNTNADFALHDFGFRGVSSYESAGLGGAAHLINFLGTDTVAGVLYAKDYYNADPKTLSFSIPASEHSTITSWGKDGEGDAYANMVDKFAKEGSVFACVSDSWDIYEAIRMWHSKGLFDTVRVEGSRVVIRPDSGDPHTVPVECVKLIMDLQGYTTNAKGYRVLPDHIRVIQGDGITIESLPIILDNMKAAGLATENLAFGMGGGLLQHVNRDTFKFAMKCSAIEVGEYTWHDVYKDPVTDPGKVSKKGRLTLMHSSLSGEYKTIRNEDAINLIRGKTWTDYPPNPEYKIALNLVYEHDEGDTFRHFYTFDEVRQNAKCKLTRSGK